MSYTTGEAVIYPHHGVARIEDVFACKIRGEGRTYPKLRIIQGGLEIQILAGILENVGARDVSDGEQLKQVFTVLQTEQVREPSNQSRRYKANLKKLTSGDVTKMAEVVRGFTRYDADRHLSAGEKRMLLQAQQILGSGAVLAWQVSEGEALELLGEILGESAL